MLDIVKVLVDNGMSKQVDLDRVSVNIENLYTQLSTTDAAYEQQINMIKYMFDMPVSETIILTGKAETLLISELTAISDFSEHIDIKMLEQQKDVYLMNRKIINNGYDNNIISAQMEIRQHIFGRFGCAAWVGAGIVFPEFKKIDHENILPTYGLGLRWEFKHNMNLRIDYGFGNKTGAFIVSISEAF
ncbi:MAG: hypothetical protein LBQ22_03020 [Bacteroidales bacterium]|jgi:hypothetical protein|nr:hypothetical protein [Bacteroidales bacterium]